MPILGIIPIATGIVGLFGLNDPIFDAAALHRMRSSTALWVWLGLGTAPFTGQFRTSNARRCCFVCCGA